MESVQRKFTRKLCQRTNITFSNYEERLAKLNLESLESRRIKRDLILLYKIIHNLVDIDTNTFFMFSSLGGYNLWRHQLHINRQPKTKTLCREKFFTHRVIKFWNDLPEEIVMSQTLSIFKSKLNKLSFGTRPDVKKNFCCDTKHLYNCVYLFFFVLKVYVMMLPWSVTACFAHATTFSNFCSVFLPPVHFD